MERIQDVSQYPEVRRREGERMEREIVGDGNEWFPKAVCQPRTIDMMVLAVLAVRSQQQLLREGCKAADSSRNATGWQTGPPTNQTSPN